VELPGIFNDSTGCIGNALNYFFYTEDTAQAFQGSSFRFTIVPETRFSNNQVSIGIWIDFNQDQDFEDDNEFVFTNPTLTQDSIKGLINIPGNALTGTTRLRIILFDQNFINENNSCGIDAFRRGEAEDYPIFINPQAVNDVAVSNYLSETTKCGFTDQEQVTVRVKNEGTSSQTNIPISFQLNSGPVVSEIIGQTISSGDSIDYTFTSTIDLSTFDTYRLSTWLGLVNDQNKFNDSILDIEIISRCYCIPDDPTNCSQGDFVDRVQINSLDNSPDGTGCSGNPNGYSLITEDTIFLVRGRVSALTLTPNRNRPTSFGVWIDKNQNNQFEQEKSTFEFVMTTPITITPVTGRIAVGDEFPLGFTRLRVRANFNIDLVDPCETSTFGETEDYIVNVLPPIDNDLGVKEVLLRIPSPVCNLTEESLSLTISNFGLTDQPGFTLAVSINGAPPTLEFINSEIRARSNTSFTTNTKFDLSEPGDYHFDIWTILDGDTYNFNDTLKDHLIQNIPPSVTPLPLNEDFESDTFPPENWTIVNEDNQEKWSQFLTDEGANKAAFVRSLAFISFAQIDYSDFYRSILQKRLVYFYWESM